MTERTMVPLVPLLKQLERCIEESRTWSKARQRSPVDEAYAGGFRDACRTLHDLAKSYRETVTTQD